MLKTLKWVYDLGVKQERQRIAAHLQLASQYSRTENDQMLDMMRDNADRKRPSKTVTEKLRFQSAVNDRIQLIINDMFQGNGSWVEGASIMFPDKEKK